MTRGQQGWYFPPQRHISSLIPAPALCKFIFKDLDAPFSGSRLKIYACMAVAVTHPAKSTKGSDFLQEHRHSKEQSRPFLLSVSGGGIGTGEAQVRGVRIKFMDEQNRFSMQSNLKSIKEDGSSPIQYADNGISGKAN